MLHPAITAGVVFLVYGSLEPILSLRLLDYDLNNRATGLVFGVEPLCYMVGTFLSPYLFPKWIPNRVILITGLFILASATLFVGPVYEETSLVSMNIGLAISGFMMGFLIIPNMPEMMQACRDKHPMADLDHANSLLSGMLNAGFGIGQALGPLSGSLWYQLYGFRLAMNITAAIAFTEAVLYLLCAQGFSGYRDTCRNFSKRNLKLSVVEDIVQSATEIRHSAAFRSSVMSSQKVDSMLKVSNIMRQSGHYDSYAEVALKKSTANPTKNSMALLDDIKEEANDGPTIENSIEIK